jgi:2-polyprenyl-6-methoxyphenol hydroxylase-like FAD-dependent oxidoreductase
MVSGPSDRVGMTKNVLISGASIAGPALAFWLRRHGFRPTVVERAPALREGGQAVDFRGPVHLDVLRRMGLIEALRAHETHMTGQRLLDRDGRTAVNLPASFFSGDLEILRGDLSRVLYDASVEGTEYVFGDQITSITETPTGVDVTFAHGAPRTFDLVIGADGLHSGVRSLVFGPESEFTEPSGYFYGGATVPNLLGLDRVGLSYNVPGLGVTVSNTGGDTAHVGFVFHDEKLAYDRRDEQAQRAIVARRFGGLGWEVPRLLKEFLAAPEIYFDSISLVRMDSFVRGRVALLGDAGYGATIGGMGTGMAVVGAYVLAGELAMARGDHRVALARYAELISGYAKACQKVGANAGPFLAPATAHGLWLRNKSHHLLTRPRFSRYLDKLTVKAASAITLPDYPN